MVVCKSYVKGVGVKEYSLISSIVFDKDLASVVNYYENLSSPEFRVKKISYNQLNNKLTVTLIDDDKSIWLKKYMPI